MWFVAYLFHHVRFCLIGRYVHVFLICLHVGKYRVSLDVLNWHIFRRLSNGSEFIKIAKKSNRNSDDDELEKLARKIRSEVRATPKPGDYNLSDYVRHKVTGSTGAATLLNLVSSLVSGGAITKPSLTLAQCIQQHICGAGRNHTTLGLVVKLHHKHCSSELIKTPNEHGITRIDVCSDNILLLYVSYVLVIFWSF